MSTEEVIEQEYLDEQVAELEYLETLGLLPYLASDAPARRTPVNIATVMRGGTGPPDMLLDGYLVRAQLHWLYSDSEAGKTWLALLWALRVIRNGGRILWVDEELGARDIADRLRALGATPDEVEQSFIYLPFPGWEMNRDDTASWQALVRVLRPDLTVFDTATDALANAQLDENKGVDVTQWVKAYCETVRTTGSAVLVLDHTGRDGTVGKHAVGSRAKRAKAKVQFGLEMVKPYDRDTVGEVKLTLTKNTLGAVIERERKYSVGGDGEGNFVFEDENTSPGLARAAADNEKKYVMHRKILDLLRISGPLTVNQIDQRITGKRSKILTALKELTERDVWPVQAETVGRSTSYRYVGEREEYDGSDGDESGDSADSRRGGTADS